MTRIAKFALFASSLSPLLLLLAVRYLDRGALPLGLAAAGFLAGAAGLALVAFARGDQTDTFVVDEVESRAESLSGYLVGYLFPFLVLDPTDSLTVAATVLLLVLLAVIYVEGNLVYLNPLLLLQGRQLYTAKVHRPDDPEDRRVLVLIADSPFPRPDQCFITRQVAGDVRLADLVNCDG